MSIPGVTPSRNITWFQAQAAAANSGKRLLTNAEWQVAAQGTVDPGSNDGLTNTMCNTFNFFSGVRETGLAGSTPAGADSCISRWGVQDMVGNLWEWVADWWPLSTGSIPPLFAGDDNSMAGASTTSGPSALIRGGSSGHATEAGVFSVQATVTPSHADGSIGFRAAR